jgi:hypothetical protein
MPPEKEIFAPALLDASTRVLSSVPLCKVAKPTSHCGAV